MGVRNPTETQSYWAVDSDTFWHYSTMHGVVGPLIVFRM